MPPSNKCQINLRVKLTTNIRVVVGSTPVGVKFCAAANCLNPLIYIYCTELSTLSFLRKTRMGHIQIEIIQSSIERNSHNLPYIYCASRRDSWLHHTISIRSNNLIILLHGSNKVRKKAENWRFLHFFYCSISLKSRAVHLFKCCICNFL